MNNCSRVLKELQRGSKILTSSPSRTASFVQTTPLDRYVQVLPVIKLSPSYPNGKILLGNWKFGNYHGRYTGLIEKFGVEPSASEEDFASNVLKFAKDLVPVEIRGYVADVKCQGVLKFDGPPDSLEYICLASINSIIDIQSHVFSPDYPYKLEWFDLNQIPFKKMPADDELWYPRVLQGKQIKGYFIFGGLESRSIKSYELTEVKDLEL